jgi:hypothetical protein
VNQLLMVAGDGVFRQVGTGAFEALGANVRSATKWESGDSIMWMTRMPRDARLPVGRHDLVIDRANLRELEALHAGDGR